MKPVVVSDVLAVGEFPTTEQLAILAKAGFKSILNNQPDGEVDRFQSASFIESEAKRLGLGYAYAPLSSRTPPRDQLALYAAALASLPAPIYAFCYSGARSAAGCALLLTGSMEVDEVIAEFNTAGFDLSALRPWLVEERMRRTGKPAAAAVGQNGSSDQRRANSGNGQDASVIAAAVPAPMVVTSANDPIATIGEMPVSRRSEAAAGLPRMVVVHPRAAGYGGFAM